MESLQLPPRTKNTDEELGSDRFSTITVASYDTNETESSATTVWGPGTLSGKAIKSLGEASLRGVDKLIVRWRLAKINAILPGLTSPGSLLRNPASGEQLEKIYDDLLELSRLDFYDAKVRQKALKMIMMQIGSREANQLLLCVAKWPREEIIIFLSEMMPCIPLLWHNTDRDTSTTPVMEADTKARLELIAVYRSSLLPSETHEVLPFIDLVARLAQEHESSCRAVIESGFLDTLVHVCDHCASVSAVVTAVQHAVEILLTCQRDWDVECTPQRLGLVWPRLNSSMPLGEISSKMTKKTPNARKQWWQTNPSIMIIERLSEIAVIMSTQELQSSCEKDMFDLAFDLLIFCDLDNKGSGFAELSMSYLVQIIAIGGNLRRTLEHVLTLMPYHNKLDFFYRIIYPLSPLHIEPMPTATRFREAVKAQEPNQDPVEIFVNFAMDVADRSHENAQAIIDAEIISLVRANRSRTPNMKYILQRIQNAVKLRQEPINGVQRPRAGTV
ncbi:hypothetical protein F5050DRAFT_283961 [Lentinula boryana]|uniref:Uncharacterized protein n=1 Tax=Lentinula boryana TaxID=40481 RepID=A0ABQ8QQS1_9AGAR|nr:hypothetical protein F5050DRAFT_283961 [Lentinula boryana]